MGNHFGVNQEGVVGAAMDCTELWGPVLLLPSCSGEEQGAGGSEDVPRDRCVSAPVMVEGQESPPGAAVPSRGMMQGCSHSQEGCGNS